MRRRIAWCWVLLLYAGLGLSSSAHAIELPSDDAPSISLTQSVEFLVTQEPLTAQQALADAHRFQPIPTRYLDIGRTRNTVWLRATLTNAEETAKVARLDTGRQYIEWMQIYITRNTAPNDPELVYEAKSTDAFGKRPIDDLILLADIEFAPRESVGLLVAFRSVDTTWLPLRIGSVRAINDEHRTVVTIDWVLNGALLAMVVFALLMAPVIRWRLAAAFAVYILTATAYVAHADGYTFRYLWPNTPGWHDAVRLCLISLMPVAALNFARQLFDFSDYAWLTRAITVLMLLASCSALGAPWIVQVPWLMTLAYLLVPVCALVQVSCGVVAIRSGQLGALPYTIGAFFVCSSFIYAAIAHLQQGHWDVDFTLDYGHLALFGETISFGVAIALRLRGLRQEALSAQALVEQKQQQLDALNHDIRQPLIALREGIAKLDGGDLQQQMTAAFDYLESLAASQPARSKDAEQENFAASMLLDGVREMFEDEATNRGVTLRVERSDANLNSDPIALMRIVSNLVANAIEHGGDEIDVAVNRTNPVLISVSDNGEGMDTQTLDQLLKRGESGTGIEGRGLGLDIVKSMAASIGADFTMESKPGQGTRARIELPPQRVDLG